MRIGWAMMMRRVEAVIMRGEEGQLYSDSYRGERPGIRSAWKLRYQMLTYTHLAHEIRRHILCN